MGNQREQAPGGDGFGDDLWLSLIAEPAVELGANGRSTGVELELPEDETDRVPTPAPLESSGIGIETHDLTVDELLFRLRERTIDPAPDFQRRGGSPYCRKAAKESVVSAAWTPLVTRMKRELGRPVRILKVMGLRSDEAPDRKKRPAFRTVQSNSARTVDEWLPVKEWPTAAVKEWHASAPVPYSWTYDSAPGAGDWAGTSRCSCSLCVYASRRDLLLSVARWPRLADLYAEVEQARGDSFRADWRITDLIHHAQTCEAPDPGIICPDDGPDFTALQQQVRAALEVEPRKTPDLARNSGRALCNGCTSVD
ncbi:phosphoadenosine phosphosulfate reductase [Streptomyces sp. NPDC058108]|uniref:phosphoadenosine phosphosulfate reductase n=1 Tax=Streptomyces sp. NPDC058108 TaxID=3346344 RepID=UPI0036E90FA7